MEDLMSSEPEFGAASWARTTIAVGIIATVSVLLLSLPDVFRAPNIISIYLFTVFLVSLRWGRATGMIAAFLAVIIFYYVFIPPRFSFSIDDPRDFITILIMSAIAFISAEMSSRVRAKAVRAQMLYQSNKLIIKFIRDIYELDKHQSIVDYFTSTVRRIVELDSIFVKTDDIIHPKEMEPNFPFKVDTALMILALQKRIPLLSDKLGPAENSYLYLPLYFKSDMLGLFILKTVKGKTQRITKTDIDYCEALAQITSARLVQMKAAA
jgi:two-component system, OmpR family, sensor histidine kinase KdpD